MAQNKPNKNTRVRKKARPKRQSYMLDGQTLADLCVVQDALRAASASEAVRRSISSMSTLVRHVKQGGQIRVIYPEGQGKPPIAIDIPAAVVG